MVRIRQPKPRLDKIIVLLVLSCLLPSCGNRKNKQFDPVKVAFAVQSNPLMEGQLYPSLILALESEEWSSPLTVSVTAPASNALLRIIIDSSSLNYVTTLQEILPRRGETYTFQPSLKWKYDHLRNTRQPQPVDLTLSCYINDELVDTKNIHLTVRTINECPLSFRHQGTIVDTRWLFAAYVNEDHPQIPQILTDILEQGSISSFTGYQSGNTRTVTNQVFAVWLYALSRGITYSSISCTSNPSPNANVQHIRFFDEVYSTRQANCIDACVFLASILRKIGLRPVIFVEPCHAYLGYYTKKNKSKTGDDNIALLETTVTSWVNFPQILRTAGPDGYLPEEQLQKIAKYLTPQQLDSYRQHRIDTQQILTLVARSLFDKASEYNRDNYNANRQLFADSAAITYQQLDIEKLRQLVQPIN